MKIYEVVGQDSSGGRDQCSVRVLVQFAGWCYFCLLFFLLLSSVTVTTASTVTATDAVPGLLAPWSFSGDRRKPTTASIVLITITNTLLCLITIFYCYCRISAAPVSVVMQNFCSTSQWCDAEFLQYQSAVWCRISAAPVSVVMQNVCSTSQWWDVEFLWY